jgi:prephenate dehydrogenase
VGHRTNNHMKKIVIVGVGLIGGSFALAQRALGNVQIVGVDRHGDALEEALQRGAIDARANFAAALPNADLVLLAIPVRQLPATLAAMSPHLSDKTMLMDVGSTKRDVLDAVAHALGPRAGHFVATHPIAGRETSGIVSADATLFAGKNVIITPSSQNTAATIETAAGWWRQCGANPIVMPADTHDAVFAAVSHLPHMLAFALVDEFASRPNAKQLFSFAASGFRDFTRIAGSSPEMWRDIALNNRDALLSEMDAYLEKISRMRALVASSDGPALESLMARARDARARWLAGELDQFRDESV